MNLIGIDSYIQQIIKGAIIVIAVAFDVTSKGKKSAKVIIADDSDKKKEDK